MQAGNIFTVSCSSGPVGSSSFRRSPGFFCVTGFYSVLSHRLRCLDDQTRKETDQRRFRALPDVPTATYLPVVILPWPLAYLLSTYFPWPIHLLPGCKYIHLPFSTCCPYLIGVYNFFRGKRPGICWWCLKQYKAAQHCCRPVFNFVMQPHWRASYDRK
jgi:hypothetical protein